MTAEPTIRPRPDDRIEPSAASPWRGVRFLVTGGTAGLGRALALQATALGARTAVVARDPARFASLLDARPGILTIRGDLGVKEDIHRIAGEALGHLGGIDVLVNNASALGPTPLRLLLDTECEDLETVLAANLLGPFRLTKTVLPGMILQGHGLIVNISSDAAVSPYPGWGAYGTSKAALDHLSRIWQEELQGTGVQVLALDPGDMDTAMHRAAIPDADVSGLRDPGRVAAEMLTFLGRRTFGRVRSSADAWRASS